MRDFVRPVQNRVKGRLVLVVWYEESSRLDFVGTVRSHAKGGLALIRLLRGIKQAALHLSGTKPRERRASQHPSGTMNQAGGTSSIRYEVVRKESLSSSVRYEEYCRQDFVHLERYRMNEELVLVRLVRGITLAGHRPSSMNSLERRVVLVLPV